MLAGKQRERDGTFTVRQLLQQYCDQRSPLKKGAQPKEDERRRALWTALLGNRELVERLLRQSLNLKPIKKVT